MRIEFTKDGGAKFTIFEHNEDGSDNHEKPLASDVMPWTEVLRVGVELTNRAKALINNINLGNIKAHGTATVTDPPAKEQPNDNAPEANP